MAFSHHKDDFFANQSNLVNNLPKVYSFSLRNTEQIEPCLW